MRALAALLVLSLALGGCTSFGALKKASIEAPSFDVTPDHGDKDTVFRVDAGSWTDGLSVAWEFGDGATEVGRTAQHAYGFTNGIMTITLLVVDASGRQGVATKTVTLGSGVNAKPTVSLYAASSWIEVNTPTALTARGFDADKEPLTYTWTTRAMSGGAETILPGTGTTSSVFFDKVGTYAVKVRARDPKGAEAVAEQTIDVSKRIPPPYFELKANGTLVAGSGGQKQASEAGWLAPSPAPDTNADAARHFYSLKYPASTVIVLTWNDTSTLGFWDLDLELRNATSNQTIFKSERHPQTGPPPVGAPPFEFNFTSQPPGDYVVIVKAISGAKIDYALLVRSSLYLTPELVAQVEGP